MNLQDKELEPVEILLVEDSLADIKLTLATFQDYKLTNRVHIARDGAEALEYLFAADPEPLPRVVLLDLKLPKVDGLEVLRQIRGNDRTRMLPVVVLTSSNEDRDLLECYRLGVNSYIVKPVDFSHFAEVIRNVGLYWTLLNRVPPRPAPVSPTFATG